MTILYLHDAAESLHDAVPAITQLRRLGCSIFAIEYRGYQAGAWEHPSEAAMVDETEDAISYLVQTRHLPAGSVVLWGRGIGATIAAEANARSGQGFRIVLEDANQPALTLLGADPRTRWLPLRLLIRDRLDAAPALGHSAAPKLFLNDEQLSANTSTRPTPSGGTQRLYADASTPKRLVHSEDEPEVRSFLAGDP